MKKKKSLTFYIFYMLFVIIFSNILVDLIFDGNLQSILEKPVRFFTVAVTIGVLGGFIIWKYVDDREA